MGDDGNFDAAIRRIRAGDESAAAELVRRYEQLIRREVRLHLEDDRLRRLFDSMDVVQSVLASFFIRTAAGEYDLDSPEQLTALLVQMARNKLASSARAHYRGRRDVRRTQPEDEPLDWRPGDDDTPSERVANQELLDELRRRLTKEERQIAALRGEGRSWDEVAAELGGKSQSRRMQLARAVERAAREMGFAELYE
jgi:RNA polymerase sigma-70 factor (ECF subfamily)